MKRVSTHGDWEEWVAFFLDAIATQADESRARTRRITDLHRTYRDRVRGSKNRQQAALASIDLIMERVYVSVKAVSDFAGCSKPTAKLALDSLAELGIVSVVPGLYPRTWVAQELIDQVYK
jgi:Fic family protein